MPLRSPLARVLHFGAAGEGTGHWWAQRVSAAGLALLAPWLGFCLARLELADHGAVTAWLSAPVNTLLVILLVAVAGYHSWLGVRVVIEDYTRGWARIIGLVVVQFLHVLVGGVGVIAVLRVALGD